MSEEFFFSTMARVSQKQFKETGIVVQGISSSTVSIWQNIIYLLICGLLISKLDQNSVLVV